MNSKKLIEKHQYKYYPYNYRFIEIVKKTENEMNEVKTIEIKNIQSSDNAKFFYKPIKPLPR